MDIVNTPGFKGYVTEDDSQIVGLVLGHRKRWWRGDIYYLNEMCVSLNRQGEGIGTAMMKFVKEDVQTKNIIT